METVFHCCKSEWHESYCIRTADNNGLMDNQASVLDNQILKTPFTYLIIDTAGFRGATDFSRMDWTHFVVFCYKDILEVIM